MNKPTFKKTNLSWVVDYDYERSGCHCDAYERGDYCRCTTIERAWVEEVNVQEVVDALYSEYHKNTTELDKYCFDRICHTFKIYDKDLYEVETGSGYYGEEVYGVYFDDEEKIVKAYHELTSLKTDAEKVKYCLKLEYGYLLECVTTANHSYTVSVVPDLVKLPNREYFTKVNRDVVDAYRNRKLPIAVCVKECESYRLIDGYHRFVANNDNSSVRIVVLE